ncbi:MAG: hypothetical protein LBM06_01390 [Prevotellaceae bacterium]|jgi:hypothetical protein|nr:hypothetical protein [Prevotellaceae bacterium]
MKHFLLLVINLLCVAFAYAQEHQYDYYNYNDVRLELYPSGTYTLASRVFVDRVEIHAQSVSQTGERESEWNVVDKPDWEQGRAFAVWSEGTVQQKGDTLLCIDKRLHKMAWFLKSEGNDLLTLLKTTGFQYENDVTNRQEIYRTEYLREAEVCEISCLLQEAPVFKLVRHIVISPDRLRYDTFSWKLGFKVPVKQRDVDLQ